jgi:hypothetical protein
MNIQKLKEEISEKSDPHCAYGNLRYKFEDIIIEGSIITADAMICHKTITAKITGRRADYVVGLKGNQDSLFEYDKLYSEREYYLDSSSDWLPQTPEWSNLKRTRTQSPLKTASCPGSSISPLVVISDHYRSLLNEAIDLSKTDS